MIRFFRPFTIFRFAPASADWTSDYEKLFRDCGPSLTWRGKRSASQTWHKRWKRESWIRDLSTRICTDSLGISTEALWISYREASRASRLVKPASEKGSKMSGTCGLSSEPVSSSSAQGLFSSKTSKESQQPNHRGMNRFCTMSSATWKEWILGRRRDALRREKSARHTAGGDGSSSAFATLTAKANQMSPYMLKHPGCAAIWPTPDASVEKYRLQGNTQQSRSLEAMGRTGLLAGPRLQGNHSKKTNRPALLNPDWVEMLMGFPVGWTRLEIESTDSEPSEMRSSQTAPPLHLPNSGTSCTEPKGGTHALAD